MAWIVAWVTMALSTGMIASSKGRSKVGYFLLGLMLPLIGLLIAICVSNSELTATAQRSKETARRNGGEASLLVWLIVGGLGVLAFSEMTFNNDRSPDTPYDSTGCSASRRAIELRLRAPGSAKWGDCHSATTNGVQMVRLSVDSQDGAGAPIRSQWATTVRNNKAESVVQLR